MTGPDFEITPEIPNADEYVRLRAAAGMSPRSIEAATAGLPNTWYGVTVRDGDRLIGMGRIIGDGGLNFELVDIAVDPPHQGKGLGKRIFSALMEYLRANGPKSAYVSLIADGEAKHLYAQFGFEPVTPASIGMALRL